MSVNKPGLPKLNVKSEMQTSFKSALSSKLATTQRSSVSYGIFAQRSNSGVIHNPKAYLSPSTSATRHALLDNRVKVFNNNVPVSPTRVASSDNTNKYAAALVAMQALSQTISPLINSKADAKGDAKTNTKSSAEGAIGDLANAKNSAEIKEGLEKLGTELSGCETDITKAGETIESETKLKSEAETALQKAETGIESEKQNIQKQTGTITKLQSSIQTDKMTLSGLKAQLSTSGEMGKMALEQQISQLEAKINQQENQLKEAEQSKKASEDKIKNELEPEKEKQSKAIDSCKQNIETAEAKKKEAATKKEKLEASKGKYEKKLTDAQNKETKQLASLHTELANYAKQFQSESDAGKKNKISEKYVAKAKEYNELCKNTSVSGYTEVALDLNS